MATATHDKQKPVYTSRSSAFEVAAWSNPGKENSTYYTVTLRKSWKEDDGQWKDRSIRVHYNQTLGASQLLRWADNTIQRAFERNPDAEEGKPIASLKRSTDKLEVAVWKNVGENGDYYTASLTRSYKQDGQWHTEKMSFFQNELLTAAHILERGFTGIDEHKADKNSQFVETAKQTFNADQDEDIPF